MKYTDKQKEYLLTNNKARFRTGVKINLEPSHESIPILPKARKIEYETIESKMNTETFEEFKQRTYGAK